MKQQNNDNENLRKLWLNGKITDEQYFFRLKADELNIKIYSNEL
jgi:hypothetical protein